MTQLEAVLVIRDEHGNVSCGLYHDTEKQTREFYKWEKMDVEEIAMLINGGKAHDVANGRKLEPKSTNLEEVTVISKK